MRAAVNESSTQQPTTALIGALALLTAVPPLAVDTYLPGFPRIAADLHTTASTVQLTLTAFLIGLAAGQLVIGPLSDNWGRRIPLLVGAAVCLAAAIVAALAPSIGVLIGARFVQGFAGAAGVVLSRAVISDRVEGERAARLFGFITIIGAAAPVVAPLIGGAVVGSFGWRAVLWIIVALTAAMLLVAVCWVPESLPPQARRSGGVSALVQGMAVVVRNRNYLGYTLGFGFGFCVMFSYISASPFVFQRILGLSPGMYSLYFAANAIGLMVMSYVASRLAGKVPLRVLIIAGLATALAAAVMLLALASTGLTLLSTELLLFVAVASLGLVVGSATTLATAQVPELAGTGSALLGALQFALAAVISPLVGLGGEGTAVPMTVAMCVCAVVALAAVLLLTTRDAATL